MEENWILDNLSDTLGDNETFYADDVPLDMILGPRRDSLHIVIPITVIYAIIFLSGLIGNVSTCVVIARNKSMHTATNYYLFNLAISDLLLLVSGLPQEMYSIWYRYPYIFGYTFCVLRGLFSETSANATVLTITAFTVERYVAICHPFLSHTLAKLSRIVKLILTIWIVAVCFAIPQALQFGVVRFIDDVPESDMCQVVKPIMKHSFEVSTFLFFVAPMTLITVLYVLIGIRLKNSTNMMKKECGESNRYQGSTGSSYADRKIGNRHQNSRSSRRVLKMLVAVVVAFFICWAPFHAQRLIAIYMTPPTDASERRNAFLKIYEITTYISGILYYVSTTINPVLYNIMSNKFREAFKETFARCCCLSRNRSQQRSYSVLSRSNQRGPDSTDSGRDDPSVHTNTTLIQRTSTEPLSPYANIERRSCKRPGSFDSEKGIVTFSWTANRSDIRITMAPKTDYENIQPSTKLVAVHVSSLPQTRVNKFMQFFHCIARKTLDDGKRLTTYYVPSPTKGNATAMELKQTRNSETYSVTSGEISNSSLRNIDHASLEDELASYMLDIRDRTSKQFV